MRSLALFPLIAVLAASSALAADHGAKTPETAVGQYVDLATVALPVVWEGRLINYVFVSVRLNLRGNADSVTLRAKEPFFRDALVRAAHRKPFTRIDDFAKLDDKALSATMMGEAARIAGAGVVTSVVVTSQTSQKHSGLPKPPGRS